MDDPCSALDPIAPLGIDVLMRELVSNYTVLVVMHNIQQAARISDETGFMLLDGLMRRAMELVVKRMLARCRCAFRPCGGMTPEESGGAHGQGRGQNKRLLSLVPPRTKHQLLYRASR
jgi:energy-coupling factor transporter ATP-binding protein EcfA2